MSRRQSSNGARHLVRAALVWTTLLVLLIAAVRISITTSSVSAPAAEASIRQRATMTILGIGVPVMGMHLALIHRRRQRRLRLFDAMRDALDRCGTEHPDVRIQARRDESFAPVVNAFNAMASRIDQRIRQLSADHSQQQAILESMSAGVVALDREQRVLEINQAARQMLGLTGEAHGRLVHEIVRVPDLLHYIDETLDGTAPDTMEFTSDRESSLTLQAMTERLTDADGYFRGMLLILNDVTQLRRLETLRSDFAANVSHELRTPITNIRGYVETLQEIGFGDTERASRFLSIIRKNSSRLAAIVEDIMALTKLEQPTGGATLQRSDVPLARVIASAISQFQNAAAARQTTITLDICDDVVASVHTQLLEQAVSNLISNAINYSPAGTKVTVRLEVADGMITISVNDQGPGIPAEHLPRLFERFYRVDKARSRVLGGTGLGLALTKHIAIVHGGHADVESELGKGSTFFLRLPASLITSESGENIVAARAADAV